MNGLWPTVAEERLMALADRSDGWTKDGLLTSEQQKRVDAALAAPWKSNGPVASIVFFALTSLAVAFTFGLCKLLDIPGGFVTLIAIAAAEALIIGQRWFGTGVESALWLGGLLAFIFSLPSSGKPEALLVIAAAVLISGLRVRNAILITIATIIVLAYLGAKHWPEAAIAAGVAAGVVALVAGTREWKRPSTDLLWDVALVLLPVTGAVVCGVEISGRIAASWALVFAFLAVACLYVGVKTRSHAPLVAGFVDLGVIYGILESNHLLPYEPETQAIIGGLLLLASAGAMSRAFRGKTRGITATPVRMGELEELTQLAGAMHVQHQHSEAAPAAPQPVSGGGSFGGAGATGDY